MINSSDAISINDLVLPISLQTGAQWPQKTDDAVQQPISISLSLFYNVRQAASLDDITCSINYSYIAKNLRNAILPRQFESLQDLAINVVEILKNLPVLQAIWDGLRIQINVTQLRAPLHCKTVGLEYLVAFSSDGTWDASEIHHFIGDLICPAIIGVNSAERLEKQDVVVNLSIDSQERGLLQNDRLDFRNLARVLYDNISASSFLSLEALTSFAASQTLSTLQPNEPSTSVTIRVAKPSALIFAGSAEVKITRTFDDYPDLFNRTTSVNQEPVNPAFYNVAIALGSNLGDSFHNIEYALRLLEYLPQEGQLDGKDLPPSPFVRIVNTSFLYKTAPMYVTDQPAFINGACMAETNIPPIALLSLLKKIELVVGRVPSIRNGPRAVDLDIIFCGSNIIDTRSNIETLDNLDGELVVPHPRVQEREFVLRPLNDMIPDYIHPVLQKSVRSLLAEVFDPSGTPMNKVIPFPRLPVSSWQCPYSKIDPVPATLTHWTYPSDISSRRRTKGMAHTNVMATLNVTPDSFSDGALRNSLPAAIVYVQESVMAGAAMVDIGGYSSRPGATFVSVEEELSRVLPTLQALRNPDVLRQYEDPTGPYPGITERIIDIPVSVDTYRWEVAEAALQAGANCINDVYAFTGPKYPLEQEEATEYMTKLTALARRHAAPVMLMHSRGADVKINNDYTPYAYADTGNDGIFLEGVRVELGEKVEKVVREGVRRWLIVADPGIGYSKTLNGNLEVLRKAAQLVEDVLIGHEHKYRNPLAGLPLLIGVSKKSFLGQLLAAGPHGRKTGANDRNWATAAAVSTSVQQGALIARVHDVKEMMDVVRVAEAIWF